jgi:mRNA interferase RelE/StbE
MKRPTYKLRVPDSLVQLVRGMHPHLKRKIKASLKLILSDPNEGKTLKNDLAGLRSFRVSRFRIIYRIQKNVIEIIAIGPRERIYEETLLILKKEARR